MKLTVVYPSDAHSAYKIAAEEFAVLAKKVAGIDAEICTDTEPTYSETNTLVLVGNDAVNTVTRDLYLFQTVAPFSIRYGTDDYCIRTLTHEGRDLLILAGGRPRSALYAVYRYFEKFCNCRWFWDGDRIPQGTLSFRGIDLTESPVFEYRGLRYFAHRSLHRFQAEHWSLEDWKTEIDWIVKKRLNLFMLRIGVDDIFQKAFPDVVAYPDRDKPLPEATEGYDDRNLFWSLEYRGELRKKLLEYAFERDLIHPEDCGTMTHWYSRTPYDLLRKENLQLLPQSNPTHNDETGRVWEVRDKKNFQRYMELTDTHVREYGRPEMFHTIGLGERRFSKDPEENKRMKLFVYHAIASQIKERYPNAPLLLASWDFWLTFSPQEVQQLMEEMDPSQTILFDYTSDSLHQNNYTQWNIMNKFPWVFGIFGGYAPNSEIRGNYDVANERLRQAKEDPFCKGLILWPELSHGDPFTLDIVTRQGWEKETPSLEAQTDLYCQDRYPAELVRSFSDLWRTFLPVAQLLSWSQDNSHAHNSDDMFTQPITRAGFKEENRELYEGRVKPFADCQNRAVETLKMLSAIETDDVQTLRDMYDIARTVIGRYLNAVILQAEVDFTNKAPVSKLEESARIAEELTEALVLLLGSNEEYSLLDSLKKLQAVTETNPNFEATLKQNAENYYCRSYIYENALYLYLPEMKALFTEAVNAAKEGRSVNREALQEEAKAFRENYYAVALSDMKRRSGSLREICKKSAELIENMKF